MEEGREAKQDRTMKRILLMISCIMLIISTSGGPLVSRLYFLHGGNRIWLSSFLQVAGFPIILLPLFVIRRRQINTVADSLKVKMATMKLPLFVFSAIIGLIIALDCYLYSYGSAHLPVISREAKHFGLGKTTYYVVLVGSAIIWQMGFIGGMGMIFCTSSLFTGVFGSLSVPITEILAVIFYKEKFQVEKGVSLVLSIWGFVSFFYGEYKQTKKELPQNDSVSNP
ncbi:hypothetical protein RIF29_21011 [Crotalaria pallida]|uniref:Uncharacterized protein n=1 Tax=Crotalaria pallida TaxID=3830 RepID=A0AAN9I804_CROPI